MAFDSTRIVAQMTIKGSLPEGRFTSQELLDFAYDSLLSELVPSILEAREEYYVDYQDYPITGGQAAYVIPTRAINGVLREIQIIRGNQIIDLPRVDLEEVADTTSGQPTSFYISGNSLYLCPPPFVTADTLRVYFFLRPSRLVPNVECARITAINGNTVTITIPTGWTTADTFDLVRGRANFDLLDFDLEASSVAAGEITFVNAVPSTLIVGDYVTLAEETCFPQLPPEGHVSLVQSAVTTALESMGDPSATVSAQKSAALSDKFKSVLKTRIQGAPKAWSRRLL